MRTTTPYCFLTGLINTLAMDWTGSGPVYRQWRIASRRDFYRYGLGQVAGGLTQLSLICGAFVLGAINHTFLALTLCALMFVGMLAANVIALRLP